MRDLSTTVKASKRFIHKSKKIIKEDYKIVKNYISSVAHGHMNRVSTSWAMGAHNLHKWRLLAFSWVVFSALLVIYDAFASGVEVTVIYMTNWGLYVALAAFYMLLQCSARKLNNDEISRDYAKLAEKVFALAWCLEFVVLIIFWTAVFPSLDNAPDMGIKIMRISTHAIVQMLLGVELAINHIKFRGSSLKTAVFVFLVYGLWNFSLRKIFNITVYKPLTWESAISVYFVVAVIAIIFIAHQIGRKVHKLKVKHLTQSSAEDMATNEAKEHSD